MHKVLGVTLIVLGLCGAVMASTAPVPEIDPASIGSAVALLSGAAMVIRARKK